MRTRLYPIVALAALTLVYCKSTKPATTATPAPVTINNSGSDAAIPTQLQAAEKRWPGSTDAELSEGKTIFTTKCVKCHRAYPIEGFSEKKWLHEIDDMSPKAKLTADEKLRLTKYVLSYRDLKETVKQQH